MRGRRRREYERTTHTSTRVCMYLLALVAVVLLGVSWYADRKAESRKSASVSSPFDYASVPAYDGHPYFEVNGDVPFFTESGIRETPHLEYAKPDALGRCRAASACLSPATLAPQGAKRGAIGHIRPSGWHTVKYDCIRDKYLYNRCHMIAWSLSGTLDDERNLVTGTKYLNLSMLHGMEYETLEYIRETGNRVLYRVTPVFTGNDLLCRGLLMEAKSVEDDGAGLEHCRFFYNVQPGIEIDYEDGSSEYSGIFPDTESPAVNAEYARRAENPGARIRDGTETRRKEDNAPDSGTSLRNTDTADYVLNLNSKKFHLPSCENAGKIKSSNRSGFDGTREELIRLGYEPAGCCSP